MSLLPIKKNYSLQQKTEAVRFFRQEAHTFDDAAWVLAIKISTLSEWNRIFNEKMAPLIVPDGRGKGRKITSDMVREIIEVAKELKSKGRRICLKSFAKQVKMENGIVLRNGAEIT